MQRHWRKHCSQTQPCTRLSMMPRCFLTHPAFQKLALAKRVQVQWWKHCSQTPPCTRSSMMPRCFLTHPALVGITLANQVQRQWRKHCSQTPPCTRLSMMPRCFLTHPAFASMGLAKRVQRQWRKHCSQTPPCKRSGMMPRWCLVPSHPSSLSETGIGEAGAKALAEALLTNTTLHTLEYDAAVLSHPSSFDFVESSNNMFEPEDAADMEESLERNQVGPPSCPFRCSPA